MSHFHQNKNNKNIKKGGGDIALSNFTPICNLSYTKASEPFRLLNSRMQERPNLHQPLTEVKQNRRC